MTVEQGLKEDQSVEKIFASLQGAVEPVLSGDKTSLDILAEVTNPFEGKTVVYFFPVPGILGERGKQLLERLMKEYGCLEELGFGEESPRKIDSYSSERVWHFPVVELPYLVFTRQEVFDNKRGFESPIRVTWSIANLHPKSRRQKLKEKVIGLKDRIGLAVIGEGQYIQE